MENIAALSLVAVYSAMGVYTISFILFTFDLAKRSAAELTSAAVVEVTSARQAGGISTAVRATTTGDSPPTDRTADKDS